MSTANPKGYSPLFRSSAPAALVNANHLLQNRLQALSAAERNDLVLRCEDLPLLAGDEEALAAVFSRLLGMILDRRQPGTRLYLHIDAIREPGAGNATTAAPGRGFYRLRFHTNAHFCAEWMQAHERHLNAVAALLQPLGGSLEVNQLKNTGCLFCLNLPGKP